jgi:hypothetical protein
LAAINSLRTAELIFIKFDTGEFHTKNFWPTALNMHVFVHILVLTFKIFIRVQVFWTYAQCTFSCKSNSFESTEREKIL